MTEEEAKTKLCVHQPFERSAHHQSTQDGQVIAVKAYFEPKCLGSGCMAWRWNYTRKTVPKDLAEAEEAKGFKVIGYEATAFDVTYKMAKRLDDGYCGLAGKP